MKDPFASLANLMHRWRWFVPVFWILLLLGPGPFFARTAADQLKGGGLSVPGTESHTADSLLADEFDLGSQSTLVAVFHSSGSTVDDAAFRNAVTEAESELKSISGIKAVTTYYDNQQASLVSSD